MRAATKHLLQEGASWTAGAVALAAGIFFFDDIKSTLVSGTEHFPPIEMARDEPSNRSASFAGEVHLKADRRGHFMFEGYVNGRPITFMADTGASLVALTYEDARAAGLSLRRRDFTGRVSTANGIASVAPVTLERIRVGDITMRNVRAAVAEEGALGTNLLGMTFLRRLKSFEIRADELILIQ